jgi:hypothetical protein
MSTPEEIAAAQAATHDATPERPAVCEDCGLNYEVGRAGVPVTEDPYTCDDCGGYVEGVRDGT